MSIPVFFVENPPIIRSTSVVLTAYINTKPIGIVTLCLKHRDKVHPVEFSIVRHQAATLLGLYETEHLEAVDTVSFEITSGLGCFEGE